MQNGDPMKLNSEGLEMQKLNISTDRAQRLDGKNRIIGLIIKFIPRVIFINISKSAYCLYILLIAAKNESQFGQNI